jgi:hypothetical protein
VGPEHLREPLHLGRGLLEDLRRRGAVHHVIDRGAERIGEALARGAILRGH